MPNDTEGPVLRATKTPPGQPRTTLLYAGHFARMLVSGDVIGYLMHLPPTARVETLEVELVIECAAFPEVPAGEEPPLLTPKITRHDEYEWDWGLS